MKKLLPLLFVPMMLLTSCGGQPIYKNYLNKDYLYNGFVCRFYEDTMVYVDETTRHPCKYEKQKLQDKYDTSSYEWVTLDYNNEYVYVYAQGWKGDTSPNYKACGFFYDDNSFVDLSSRTTISIWVANNAH